MHSGYQLDHLLSLRLLKPFFDNVLLEHGGLPQVLPLAVHLDFSDNPEAKFPFPYFGIDSWGFGAWTLVWDLSSGSIATNWHGRKRSLLHCRQIKL